MTPSSSSSSSSYNSNSNNKQQQGDEGMREGGREGRDFKNRRR